MHSYSTSIDTVICRYFKVEICSKILILQGHFLSQKIYFEISKASDKIRCNINESRNNCVQTLVFDISDTLRYQCLKYRALVEHLQD